MKNKHNSTLNNLGHRLSSWSDAESWSQARTTAVEWIMHAVRNIKKVSHWYYKTSVVKVLVMWRKKKKLKVIQPQGLGRGSCFRLAASSMSVYSRECVATNEGYEWRMTTVFVSCELSPWGWSLFDDASSSNNHRHSFALMVYILLNSIGLWTCWSSRNLDDVWVV